MFQKSMFFPLLLFATIVAVSAETKLVWEENFDGDSLDRSKFTCETGTGKEGWGNKELQYYTDRTQNARVENGHLIIEARRENYGGSDFTSARIITKGLMEFKYGTLEARIKIPSQTKGLWPAFGVIGANMGEVKWPDCGHIVILEAGSAEAIAENAVNKKIGGAAHWENKEMYNTVYKADEDLTADFHTYTLKWNEKFMSASIDGKKEYFKMDIPSHFKIFQKPFFVILTLAVGGKYPNITESSGIDANFPAYMEIDYIKLYQSPGNELHVKGQK
uniref:GH16 domain-containing protein n=1 Tax=Panagrolaimus sp. ES5 TaxID=591445 RepID=A0AC34F3J5_9BILA